MRLRNVRGSRETIAASPYVVQDGKEKKGLWNKEVFGNGNPIYLEVGMGKGKFLLEHARLHPEVNYVGIEKYSSVLVRALEKRQETELDNLYFLRMDAEELPDCFAPGEVGRIYLNFSDPWPKERHAKRRLTSKEFFRRYDQILRPGGEVIFKTDNRALFEFSLAQVAEAGWQVGACTFDLHGSEYSEGNIMTEYETKFAAEGRPICMLTAYRDV